MRLAPTSTLRHLAILLVLATATLGCRSSSRWASLNPWSKSSQDASVIARTAPELPSESAANPGGSATSLASASGDTASGGPTSGGPTSGGTAPAFQPSEETLASAPTASYPTTDASSVKESAPAGGYPTTTPAAAGARAASSSPLAAAPPKAGSAGPYDASAYSPPPPTRTASSAATASKDRYGASSSRYDMSNSLPSGLPSGAGAGADSAGAADYRSTPSSSNPSTPPSSYASASPTDSLPSSTTPRATASPSPDDYDYLASGPPPGSNVANQPSEAPITTAPGAYRPGGTSDYAVSLASRTAPSSQPTPENAQDSTPQAYPTTPLGDPRQDQNGSQGYPSSSPSYR